MANAVLSVPLPADVKSEMEKHGEIKWVEVARMAIVEKLRLMDKMDALLSKSDFTEADAIRHGKAVNKKVFEHHKAKT